MDRERFSMSKVVSVVLAVLLALLMIPIVPAANASADEAQGEAAQGEAGNEALGKRGPLWYNNHPSQQQLDDKVNEVKQEFKGDDFVKLDPDKGLTVEDRNEIVRQILVQKGSEDKDIAFVSPKLYDLSWKLVAVDASKEGGAGVATVTTEKDGDGKPVGNEITIELQGAGDASILVHPVWELKGHFSYGVPKDQSDQGTIMHPDGTDDSSAPGTSGDDGDPSPSQGDEGVSSDNAGQGDGPSQGDSSSQAVEANQMSGAGKGAVGKAKLVKGDDVVKDIEEPRDDVDVKGKPSDDFKTIEGEFTISRSDDADFGALNGRIPDLRHEVVVKAFYSDAGVPSSSMVYADTQQIEVPANNEALQSTATKEANGSSDGSCYATLQLRNDDGSYSAPSDSATIESKKGTFAITGYKPGDEKATIKAVDVAQPEAAQDTLTIGWKLDNGVIVDQTIDITVSPKRIGIDKEHLTYPYRLEGDQIERVRSDFEEAVGNGIVDDDKDDVVADTDALAFSSEYPGRDGGSVGLEGAIELKDKGGKGKKAHRYTVETPSEVKVQGATEERDLKKSDTFKFHRTDNGDLVENPAKTWVNSHMVVKRNGKTFSYDLDGEYSKQLELQKAEGSYTGQTLYAKDDKTKVITYTANAAYNIDLTAPVVKAFGYPKEVAEHDGTLVFRDRADVTISVSDDANGDLAKNGQDNYKVAVSGLSNDGASVTWHDDRANQDHSVNGMDIKNEGATTGTFAFAIDRDQEVRTDTVRAYAKDVAGNVMDASTKDALKIPSDVLRMVADSTPPTISMAFDNNDVRNGKYYNADRTATITVKYPHFDLLQEYDSAQTIVAITENGETRVFNPGSFTSAGKDTWVVTYTFNNDSDYSIAGQVTDLVGRSSSIVSDEFTIDRIVPTIDVSFDNNSATNDKYYSAARTATITVTEHNFDEGMIHLEPTTGAGNGSDASSAQVGGWSNDGDTHVATVTFPGDGTYSMRIDGVDLATNPMSDYECPEFVVDNTDPEVSIRIAGSEVDGVTYCLGDAQVQVRIDDTNISSETTCDVDVIGWNDQGGLNDGIYVPQSSNGTTSISYDYPSPEKDPGNDGVFRVTVNAVDLAGRTVSKTAEWSVNRYGSTYMPTEDTRALIGGYHKPENVTDVEVVEVNPSGHSGDPIVTLSRGTDNTDLEKAGESGIGTYSVSEVKGSGNSIPMYRYSISKENFKQDSPYGLSIQSSYAGSERSDSTMSGSTPDRDGSDASINFVVDSVAPICSFLDDFEDSDAPTRDVRIQLEDNSMLDHVEVYVADSGAIDRNSDSVEPIGEAIDVTELNDELAANPTSTATATLTVNEANDDQVIMVVAYDKAGNAYPEYSPGFLVSSNPLIRWWVNKPLVIGTIFGVMGIAALAVYLVMRKRRVR